MTVSLVSDGAGGRQAYDPTSQYSEQSEIVPDGVVGVGRAVMESVRVAGVSGIATQ